MTALACPSCKRSDVRTDPDDAGYGYLTCCHNCYDVDCDENGFYATSLQAHGWTREESIQEWNWLVEDVIADEPTQPLAGNGSAS